MVTHSTVFPVYWLIWVLSVVYYESCDNYANMSLDVDLHLCVLGEPRNGIAAAYDNLV